MEWISELIGNYAFPIVCCIALFAENRDQRKSHSEEMKHFSSVIESNTIAITHLTDKMEGRDHENE